MKVFVLDSNGNFQQHGPVRKSEAQATSVAKTLARRLGWTTVVAAELPAPRPAPADAPTPTLAALSPVWKDPGLAARWAAGAKAPAPAPAPQRVPRPAADGFDTDRRLAALGLVLG